MERLTPVIRISASLVLLTASLLMGLDLVGLLPAPGNLELERRLQLSEMLANQIAALSPNRHREAAAAALAAAVERDPALLSAGLRSPSGSLLAQAGSHRTSWNLAWDAPASPTHLRVPLFSNGQSFAALEAHFAELPPTSLLGRVWSRPLFRILALLCPLSFFSYLLFMRRTLRHLDPTAVIPTRVQATLDVMAEGVVVLDEHEQIVMANAAFAERTKPGSNPTDLIGRRISTLEWRTQADESTAMRFPWSRALEEAQAFTGVRLRLLTGESTVAFSVNGCPVLDGWGRAKGVIATFDDVTAIEEKTQALEQALNNLEKSQGEVELQNEELKRLARSDPLTGVANRRAFLEAYESYYLRAFSEGLTLSVIMCDIDHFKNVNDTHGHQVGDEVILSVTEALADAVRETDAVCRYGGEEFVLVLPETDAPAAASVAERLRKHIASPGFARVPVSASFGVASSRSGARSLHDLINLADEALYDSKHAGRNRVTIWQAKAGAETR